MWRPKASRHFEGGPSRYWLASRTQLHATLQSVLVRGSCSCRGQDKIEVLLSTTSPICNFETFSIHQFSLVDALAVCEHSYKLMLVVQLQHPLYVLVVNSSCSEQNSNVNLIEHGSTWHNIKWQSEFEEGKIQPETLSTSKPVPHSARIQPTFAFSFLTNTINTPSALHAEGLMTSRFPLVQLAVDSKDPQIQTIHWRTQSVCSGFYSTIEQG